MDEEVTIQEAMKILHRSEPVVRGYIKSGKLPGSIKADGKYYIPRADVERLAKKPAQIQVDKVTTQLVKLARQLEEMEIRLNRVETMLARLTEEGSITTSPPPIMAPSASPQRPEVSPPTDVKAGRRRERVASEPKDLPAGATLASAFANQHGVHFRTFGDHCRKGLGKPRELAPVSSRPKPGREGETEYYVLPGQVPDVLAYWQRHGVRFQEPQDEN